MRKISLLYEALAEFPSSRQGTSPSPQPKMNNSDATYKKWLYLFETMNDTDFQFVMKFWIELKMQENVIISVLQVQRTYVPMFELSSTFEGHYEFH